MVLVSELLDQVDQVGVLHLLRSEDVPLVQLVHRPRPVSDNTTDGFNWQNENRLKSRGGHQLHFTSSKTYKLVLRAFDRGTFATLQLIQVQA